MVGIDKWGLTLHEDNYIEAYPKTKKEDFVYLTPDSPNIIESFEQSKIYIIGGLVDHNTLKNVCFKKAEI
jgi:tRNA (guanine9-N1)-methyltransferase